MEGDNLRMKSTQRLMERKLGLRRSAAQEGGGERERDEEGNRMKEVVVSRSFLETSGRKGRAKPIHYIYWLFPEASTYLFFRLHEERGISKLHTFGIILI